MINTDGVILGNNRCNLAGDDLNRQFLDPDRRLHPSIYAIKQAVLNLKVFSYIDIHSHSKKKGSFFYGPYFPLHSSHYYKSRIIPKLMSETNKAFRYHSCKFTNEWNKRNTARLVISKEFRVPFCYTWETSNHGFVGLERCTERFDNENLQELGESLG